MNTKSRITSILHTHALEESITGIPTFNLSELDLPNDLDFPLPTNIRLGHLVERIVAELIKASSNYQVMDENIQLMVGKTTIGELDFLIKEIATQQVIHMELAYKFYLFDPSISTEPINNWIGPNRNDSLIEKLAKLKAKQFPLLYDKRTREQLHAINMEDVTQALCLLVSLFISYQYKGSFEASYEKAIEGYYLDFETFIGLDHSNKSYFIPSKKQWGMEPSENETWTDFNKVAPHIRTRISEEQAPMIWCKAGDQFEVFFVTWW